MVGRVIGKKGATLAKIRGRAPGDVEVASKQHAPGHAPRDFAGQTAPDIMGPDAIAAKVPDLQPGDTRKTDLLEDVGF